MKGDQRQPCCVDTALNTHPTPTSGSQEAALKAGGGIQDMTEAINAIKDPLLDAASKSRLINLFSRLAKCEAALKPAGVDLEQIQALYAKLEASEKLGRAKVNGFKLTHSTSWLVQLLTSSSPPGFPGVWKLGHRHCRCRQVGDAFFATGSGRRSSTCVEVAGVSSRRNQVGARPGSGDGRATASGC